jgi:hypothetical protein
VEGQGQGCYQPNKCDKIWTEHYIMTR